MPESDNSNSSPVTIFSPEYRQTTTRWRWGSYLPLTHSHTHTHSHSQTHTHTHTHTSTGTHTGTGTGTQRVNKQTNNEKLEEEETIVVTDDDYCRRRRQLQRQRQRQQPSSDNDNNHHPITTTTTTTTHLASSGITTSTIVRAAVVFLLGVQAERLRMFGLQDSHSNNNAEHYVMRVAMEEELQRQQRQQQQHQRRTTSTSSFVVGRRNENENENNEHPLWPLWPQHDDSVRDAIRNNGRRIGIGIGIGIDIGIDQTDTRQTATTTLTNNTNGTPYYYYYNYMWNNGTTKTKCEAPPKGLATVVTAYYDLKSKHPREQYEGWIRNILRATDPMVIFIDPTNSDYFDWWPFMERNRQHAPTLLVPLPFRNLTMSKSFTDEFWRTYILPRDRTYRFRKGVDVYKIWNEKIILMREVARENPFRTEFFYWVDAGYYRKDRSASAPLYSPIVRNNITEKGVDPRSQVVYQMIKSFPTYEIAGGAWGGTSEAIQLHYEKYWETFWYLTLYSDKECVGFEQRVQVWMCRSFPKICVINKSQDWFAMGTNWLRDPDFDFMFQTFRIPPRDKTTTVPPLVDDPSSSMISLSLTFPNDTVVSTVNEIPKGSISLERHMNFTHVVLEEEKNGR